MALIDLRARAWGRVEAVRSGKYGPRNHPGHPDQKSHGRKGGDIGELRSRIDRLEAEAAPHRAERARYLEKANSGRVLTDEDHRSFTASQQRLEELKREGDDAADEMMDALAERDGSPFGGEAPAGQWQDAAVQDRGTLDAATRQQLRDEYVVQDSRTLANNAALRAGDLSAERWAGRMDRLVDSSELAHDSRLHRGAALTPERVMQLRPGALFHDKGFVSTDRDRDGAELYGESRQSVRPGTVRTQFEIRAPRGTSAVEVGSGEVVLGRGEAYRIQSSSRDSEGTVHVVMEMLS